MKTCNKCKLDLELSAFSINKSRKDGLNSSCKECFRAYAKTHYVARKSYYIEKANRNSKKTYKDHWQKVNDYKASHGCKYCSEKDPCCLDLHHRESSEKKYSIATKLGNFSWKSIEKEIFKCDVVCSNCHRKLHAGRLL